MTLRFDLLPAGQASYGVPASVDDLGLADLPDLTGRETRILLAAVVLGGLLAAFALLGVIATGCWLWLHRIGAEQTVFWLAVFAFVGWVCRFVNVHRRHR